MPEQQQLIQTFQVMPDDGVTMTIALATSGEAIVVLEGTTMMGCWCGDIHNYTIRIETRCGTSMENIDMNDLDKAIHGESHAARRFAWRLLHQMFFYETPPCEEE